MKKKIKKIKIKIKGWLLVKLAQAKKEIRILRGRIADDVLSEQQYIDALNNKDRLIRDLLLKLDEDTRDMWLKENNYERYYTRTKQVKKKV